MVDKVLSSFNPKSRSDYLWYLQFTFSVLLLKDLPTSIFGLQGHLLSKCFTPSTVTWDANPVKVRQWKLLRKKRISSRNFYRFQMDYFASPLYNIMEDDKNLIFVTSQIENRSSFGFYMSLCMLWKSIYGCIGVNQPMFRLYPVRFNSVTSTAAVETSMKFCFYYFFQPTDLIDITKKISKKNIDKCFDTILNFIILHSKIASLVFHRKHRTPHYKCYEEFFEFDAKLINYLKKFLETLMDRVDSIWRRQSDNLDYLTVSLLPIKPAD